ncbi:glutathione S-transferase N-terminal domain-containing protein [Falsiroseomonas oryzae]|nr:glutathione S-transferase N-terminal domain-containing protein [Roseomonas sp. MO-31]
MDLAGTPAPFPAISPLRSCPVLRVGGEPLFESPVIAKCPGGTIAERAG